MKKQASFQNGLVSVPRTFCGLMVPMAEYVMTQYVQENAPIIGSSISFSSKIGLTDVQVDVNRTYPCIEKMTAFYPDKIITASMQYGEYNVVAYCKNREAAKQWQDQFEYRLVKDNQYRGKCLYAEAGSMVFSPVPDTGWEDVVLNDKIKKDIRLNTVSFLGDKKLAKAGVLKRGLVMFGPPGTGKTSVVKAIFRELNNKEVSRIYVTAESFRRMSIGNLFDMIKYLGPTVLAFEDVDFVGTSRDVHIGSNLLGDLLTNLDGMRKYTDPLVVMASTNKIEMLDEALSNRPGRFDRRISIGLPNKENLKKIYMKLVGTDINDDVIELSSGFTGSHVTEAVNTARILATSENKDINSCLIEACNIVKENFFPGQDTTQLKAAVQAHMIKKGYKTGFQKQASKMKKTAAMIAEQIIVNTDIYSRLPSGQLVKKTIWEKYVNDSKEMVEEVVAKKTAKNEEEYTQKEDQQVREIIKKSLKNLAFDERDSITDLEDAFKKVLKRNLTTKEKRSSEYKKLEKLHEQIEDAIDDVAYNRRKGDKVKAAKAMANYEKLVSKL